MKKKIFILDYKKILHKLFFTGLFKAKTEEKENNTVFLCQELKRLRGEIRLISDQLEKLNSGSSRAQEVQVENLNLEKVVLESLSINLGDIDVDTVNGTMNLGVTVNLQSGALSLPDTIKVSESTPAISDPTLSFVKQTSKKEAAYNICIRPNCTAQEITPKITRIEM